MLNGLDDKYITYARLKPRLNNAERDAVSGDYYNYVTRPPWKPEFPYHSV